MGIKDLLSLLKPAIKPCHISEYRGKKVAVDGNVSSPERFYTCSCSLSEEPRALCSRLRCLFN